MTMNDQKVKLALRIIGDQFGDIVQDVARVLTEGDKCTIPHIFRTVNANISARALLATTTGPTNKRGMNIDGATVRTALMVLYQHNCLFVDPPKAPETVSDNPLTKAPPQTGFLYSLNVSSVLHRLHFARLLSIIRAKYGEVAVHVAEAVMLHGKMRLDQIQDQVVLERSAASTDGSTVTPQEVKTAFEVLVSNRFIITVPLADKSRTSEPTVTFNVAEGGGRSGVKRTFDFLSAGNPTAETGGKRSKTAAAKPTAAPTATSSRRIAAPKLAPADDGDDGIPVELRMMMGGLDSAPGAGKKVAAEQSANTANRGSSSSADAEWTEDSMSVTSAGRGGRGAGRGGRGGAGVSGGRLVGRGGRGAGSSSSSQEAQVKPEGTTSVAEAGGVEGVLQAGTAAPLWMIGWDQFIRETRHAACVQIVTLLHESVAGNVIRIMLAQSMSTEKGPKQTKSGEVSVADIFAQLEREYHAAHANSGNGKGAAGKGAAAGNKGKAGATAGTAAGAGAVGGAGAAAALPVRLDLMSLKRLLEYLRLSESGAVIKVVGSEQEVGGPSYMVSMDGLITLLQRRTIFSVASERFGFVSARIVELLQRNQYLEQQQICDMALLPARETRERLYKLFLDGWVNYVDLSKRADFNPSTSFYFWFLDLPLLKSTIRDHTYQTMHNLLVRRAHEAEGGRELLDREDCIDNEADRVKHAHLMHRLNKLDLALLQVHSSVLLMEHF